MPHVIVKLWPGKTEQQKRRLADVITKDVMEIFDYGDESVSVAMQEIKPQDWAERVYKPEIVNKAASLYKKRATQCNERPNIISASWPRPLTMRLKLLLSVSH